MASYDFEPMRPLHEYTEAELDGAHVHSCLECKMDWVCWQTPCEVPDLLDACSVCEEPPS